MSYEDFNEIYNNLCAKQIAEFIKVCSKDKTTKNAIHKLIKHAFKSKMGGFFRFSVILACISELNEAALKGETNKIAFRIKEICKFFALIFNEVEKISRELDKL